jgi:hypothetical protein
MQFEPYRTSAYAYWDRSRRLLNDFEEARHKLFYVAYELRCAIEAFLYDYLSFLGDGNLTKELEKLYRAKSLKQAIHRIEPDFEHRIAFGNLIHRAIGLNVIQIPVPDMDKLSVLYGRLGSFMHLQKEVIESESRESRWVELEEVVKEAQQFMHDLVHPQKARLKLTNDGVALFEQFKAGRKEPEEIVSVVEDDLERYIEGARYQFDLGA